MSPRDRHVILRASLEVNGRIRPDGLGFQQEAAAWAQDRLLPALDRVFASLPPTVDHVVIDRFELELAAQDSGHWGDDVLKTMETRLRAALAARLEARGEGRGDDERLSFEESFFRKLAHYLSHGTLPWNLAIASQAALEEEMAAWLAAPLTRASKPALVRLLGSPAARFRFRRSFSLPLLKQALALFFSLPEKAWDGWAAEVSLMPPFAVVPDLAPPEASASLPHPLAHLLAEAAVETLAESGFACDAAFEARFAEFCLSRLLPEAVLSREDLASIPFASPPFSQARAKFLALSSAAGPRPHAAAGPLSSVPGNPSPPAALPSQPRPDAARPPAPLAPDEDPPEHSPETEGVFVENAGLILIAPFLPALFGKLGLARKGEMAGIAAALALLQFLATGRDGAAEFQLALPKVLCGWDIREPVDVPREIPSEMKEEARQLLSSVIEHWAVLKNTSVDGLRESFLQRRGKLRPEKEGWLLQVEQKAFDMLLQHIPWTFGLVRLPWTKKTIRTEWVA